jgi:thymidylate synthase
MRSNDAYFGLPHDVFCFTMLQEMIACRLGVEVGEYYHYVGSMHVYHGYLQRMARYVDEGHQRTVAMPTMPKSDPFVSAAEVLALEKRMREGEMLLPSDLPASAYWADLVRLLQAYWLLHRGTAPERLEELRAQFANPVYKTFVDSRRQLLEQTRSHRPLE